MQIGTCKPARIGGAPVYPVLSLIVLLILCLTGLSRRFTGIIGFIGFLLVLGESAWLACEARHRAQAGIRVGIGNQNPIPMLAFNVVPRPPNMAFA